MQLQSQPKEINRDNLSELEQKIIDYFNAVPIA
jgi:hypothetical protein